MAAEGVGGVKSRVDEIAARCRERAARRAASDTAEQCAEKAEHATRPPRRRKAQRKRGPKPTGGLVWTGAEWAARLHVVVDGVRVRRQVRLGTTSRETAAKKLAELVQEAEAGRDALKMARKPEFFADMRVVATRLARLESLVEHLISPGPDAQQPDHQP